MMTSDSEFEGEIEHDEPEQLAPIKTGWLSKQGGSMKSIKKRWFTLTKGSIQYFRNEKANEMLGIIYLRRVTGASKVEDQKFPNAFEIKTPERVYLIISQNAEDRTSWVDAINAAIPKDSKKGSFMKVVKSGFLTKQGGGFKSWKKRWFVLRQDNLLSYYYEEGDAVPLGTIDLEKCLDVKLLEPSKGTGFDIVTKDRIYSILAANREDLESWLHTLLEIKGNSVDGQSVLRVPDDDDEGMVSLDDLSHFVQPGSKVTKEGYLVKQGGKIKTWKRRWFILRESTLAYYKEPKDDKPLGLILLKDCKSFELTSDKVSKPYSFEIATPDRVYVCCAKDEDEMWDWINVLSTAVTKSGGKETAEFVALKKASELAAQKKALQIQIFRKATAKNVRRKIGRYRNQNKQPVAKKNEEARWTKNIKGTPFPQLSEKDIEAQEEKMLDDLEKINNKTAKTALKTSIFMMEKDIEALNGLLLGKDRSETDLSEFNTLMQTPPEHGDFLCYARAIMDFNPNAYDDEALGFMKGDLLMVEDKAASGIWRGRLVKKSSDPSKGVDQSRTGTFPYRYVEEIDPPEGHVLPPSEKPEVGKENGKGEWSEQLDNAVGTLFEMYDTDGDGYINKLDFFEFLYEFGKTFLTDKQVDRCWEELDTYKAGKVGAAAFKEGVRRLDALDFYSEWTG